MKRILTAVGGAAIITALMASAYTFTEYKMAPKAMMHLPAQPDSTHKENPFEPESLLKSRGSMAYNPAAAGWTTMVADTAGQLRLAAPGDMAELHTLGTRLRANRFAKGKLKITTPARALVKVNGETKISKENADSTATSAEASISLLPQADYDIIVDILGMPDDSIAPDFKLEFIADKDYQNVDITSGAMQRKRVAPLSTMLGNRISGMLLSDNGKYMLTRYRETLSAKETREYATLSETASGKILSEDLVYDMEWIPGTNSLFYLDERDGEYLLMRQDVPSMRITKLAEGLPDENVTMAPDGKKLFYYKSVDGKAETGPMHRVLSPDDRLPGNRNRYYIMCYDVENHYSMPITSGGPTSSILDISPKGDKLLYLSSENTPDKYPFFNVSIIQVDLNTLTTDTLINRCASTINNAIYSPDASRLFIVGGPDAFGKVGANYDPHPIGNDFDGQGYIFDISTRKVRSMTRDFNPAVESRVKWNGADNKIYFLGEDGFYRHVYSLDPKSGKISRLDTGLDYVRGFSIGDKESDVMAAWGGSFTTDGVGRLYNLKSGKSRLFDNPLNATNSEIQFGDMKPWKFTAKDGTVVDGWYCLPPEFDASKKYPMIVYYYGGTSPSTATFYHLYTPQVFASRDYVVYVLNPSGTTGYGQEYSARHVNAWGKRTADEIIEGTKLFCKEHPFVDEKKIGCIGASYGGFMTQYLQTKTDIFAAAVSHAGISNVTSYWGEGYWGYSYNSVAAAKSYPWTDPDLFTKQGSLFNADKIHTPLLLLHGTDDTNVPIGESIQLFNALKILGRDVEFITVQNENHVVQGFDNKLAWQNTIMAWFAKWLQDDPRWWNELYKQ